MPLCFSALQGEYLSSLRSCYDDRIYPVSGTVVDTDGASLAAGAAASASSSTTSSSSSGSAAAPSTTAAVSAASTFTSSAPAPSATASASVGVNFQQKIEVAPLTQLTALGEMLSLDEVGGGGGGGGGQGQGQGQDREDLSLSFSLRSAVEQRTTAPRQSVIVIASLVDKVTNTQKTLTARAAGRLTW